MPRQKRSPPPCAPPTTARSISTRPWPVSWPSGCATARRPDESLVEPLTDREKDVLRLLGQGMSNKEIGTTLFITERTARTYVSNILGKLGLASRTQAALYAVEHKMVEPQK